MTDRRILPMRRACETFELAFGGAKNAHIITLGFYSDGTFGEIFINSGKSGETIEAITKDAAKLVSLCRQYGCPVSVIKNVVTRDGQGRPESVIGAVIDCLKNEEEGI
jgi:hypothetical protein